MVYRGRIKNGVVVFDEPVALPDGTEVIVQLPVETPPAKTAVQQPAGDKPRKKLAERYKKIIGAISDLPPDFAENHDHYIHGTPKE